MSDLLRQAPTQDMLAGTEVADHPMWSAPTEQEDMPEHIREYRKALHARLQPFDGRPNSAWLINHAKHLHLLSALESAHSDPTWLIGQVVKAKVDLPEHQTVTIGRLHDTLIESVVDTIRTTR